MCLWGGLDQCTIHVFSEIPLCLQVLPSSFLMTPISLVMVGTLYKSELSSTYKSEVFMMCVSFSSSKRGKTELPILKGNCSLFCLRRRHMMGQIAATSPLVCTDAATSRCDKTLVRCTQSILEERKCKLVQI